MELPAGFSQPAASHIRDNYDDDGFKAGAAVAG